MCATNHSNSRIIFELFFYFITVMLLLFSYRLQELGQLQGQNWHENGCIFILENGLPKYF